MKKNELSIYKSTAYYFENAIEVPINSQNLFVITHLGQLKQMEALISSKSIKNNCLVVLYTERNLKVPQSVHDQYSDLFNIAIFIEIPFGVNKSDFNKLKRVEKSYKELIAHVKPKNLYLNSFEGHYGVLISIAKKENIKTILVEEGTATYKLNINRMIDSDNTETLNFDFFKSKFKRTIGQTQIFKKVFKTYKYNRELFKQSKKFTEEVLKDEKLQRYIIQKIGSEHLKASLEPFKDFDKAYASFPKLIKGSFGIKDVDYFLIHEVVNEDTIQSATNIVKHYKITSDDILFVSQRYNLDPKEYVNAVTAIISHMAYDNQKIFIKLHPKENTRTLDAFKYIESVSNGKFIVIEESQFLIESVVKVSKVRQLIGLTSTTLIYGPLVSSSTMSISIAHELINILSKNEKNVRGIETIKQHLEIIKVFDNIEFR